MKIPINLASQPFRRDRAIFMASSAVSVVLLGTLAILTYLYMMDRSQSAQVRQEVASLNTRVAAASVEQAKLEEIIRQPENSTVLETSVFINTLLLHKGMSWSRLFTDLEETVPYDVKLISLVPTLNSQNKVVLDISAAAENIKSLIDFTRALETSTMFRNVATPTLQPPTQAEPFHRVRVTVNYAQKL